MNITFFFSYQNHFFNQKKQPAQEGARPNLILQHEIHSNQSLQPREHHSSAQKTITCTTEMKTLKRMHFLSQKVKLFYKLKELINI